MHRTTYRIVSPSHSDARTFNMAPASPWTPVAREFAAGSQCVEPSFTTDVGNQRLRGRSCRRVVDDARHHDGFAHSHRDGGHDIPVAPVKSSFE